MTEVPYDAIDAEIRPLVQLLNSFPGIRTMFSCVGHKEGEQAYVSFAATAQESLFRVIRALPERPARLAVTANQPTWQAYWVDVAIVAGEISYSLRIAGGPQYAQRQLIAEIEQTLRAALSRATA